MEFEDYKRDSIKNLEESVRLFSNNGKKETEIWVVDKFLKTINLPYTESEVKSLKSQNEPPDVAFRKACFEVMELPDEDRRRHKEFKEMLNKMRTATSYDDISKPETWDIKSVPLQALLSIAEDRLHKNKGHYSADTKTKLDMLIYVNLRNMRIDDRDYAFTLPEDSKLRQWRSISLVFNSNIVCVAYASADAPEFIRAIARKVIKSADVVGSPL